MNWSLESVDSVAPVAPLAAPVTVETTGSSSPPQPASGMSEKAAASRGIARLIGVNVARRVPDAR
jgi:hypothetical protein